jgi:hypothetical protein
MEISWVELVSLMGGSALVGWAVCKKMMDKAMYDVGWREGCAFAIEHSRRFIHAGVKHLIAIGELTDEEIEEIENSDLWRS